MGERSEPDEADHVDLSLDLAVLLAEAGVPQDEIDQATADDTLGLLAMEAFVTVEKPEFDLLEVAERSGSDPDIIRAYWRALGFPDPRPGEKIFTSSDVDLLDMTMSRIADDNLDRDLALQMSRVIGTAMDKVATGQVDALVTEFEKPELSRLIQASGPETAEMLSMVPRVLELVWRRQLGAAARRRRMRASSADSNHGVLVGFADLVGFTAKTQQLDDHELAEVVGRFEYLAFHVVADHGGRVVKMIGDEVMFIHEDISQGARLALDLAEKLRNDPALSDVRVGLASGPVLERDGDVYGHVVNVASRMVSIAYPGSVVVSREVHDALAADEDLHFRSLRSHYLKGVGKVPLWTLRRSDDETEKPYAHARERRAQREFLRARYSELLGDVVLTDEMPAELRDQLRDELRRGELPDEPAASRYDAIAAAVLSADLSPNTQVELLAELEADRRMRTLEAEAQAKAAEADLEAEDRMEELDREVRRKVHEIELDARRRIEVLLAEAEEESRKVNEEASAKVRRVAEEAERKAGRATKEATVEAKKRARKARKS